MDDKFESELKVLLNKHSQENESDTPDFILAQYMKRCLRAFNLAVKDRAKWYGKGLPGKDTKEVFCERCIAKGNSHDNRKTEGS